MAHSTEHKGLQEHSVGPLYPCVIVACQGQRGLLWYWVNESTQAQGVQSYSQQDVINDAAFTLKYGPSSRDKARYAVFKGEVVLPYVEIAVTARTADLSFGAWKKATGNWGGHLNSPRGRAEWHAWREAKFKEKYIEVSGG